MILFLAAMGNSLDDSQSGETKDVSLVLCLIKVNIPQSYEKFDRGRFKIVN